MRTVILLTLGVLAGCRAAPPRSAADEPATPDAPPRGVDGGPARASTEGDSDTTAAPPRDEALVEALAAVISAAVTGQELPETPFELPGRRGEEVVRIQGDGFPRGRLTVTTSMLKVDVTLAGCEPGGGLTLGLLQTDAGIHLVGLGDQFTAGRGAGPAALGPIRALAAYVMDRIAEGRGLPLLLDDGECATTFGSTERCHRMLQELPDEGDLERYREMLSTCAADPVVELDVVALWLSDESGDEFQALARFRRAVGALTVAEPILLAPGVP